MSADRTKFFVDSPFTKAAESNQGDLKLLGYASAWSLDRDNEYVEPGAFDKSLDRYMDSNPILLWQHDLERPIGTVEAAATDRHGLNVRAVVSKPGDREPDWSHLAYNKIKAGIVKTFSIGGFFEREQKAAKRVITGVDLFEISVVSVPSNPDSIFAAAVKSLAGPARPELLSQHVAQMKQLLGMEAFADPELAAMDEAERQERYEEISAIYKKVGKLPPGFDSFRELAAEVQEKKGQDGALDRAARVAALIQRVQGYTSVEDLAVATGVAEEETKAGRVLSKANEAQLRAAFEGIREVLDKIDKDAEKEEDVPDPVTTLAREID